MTPDLINGAFEMGGALVTCLSVWRLRRDRMMRGFHWGPTIFFTLWGMWNIVFYSGLRLPLSTIGALALVLVNCCYLLLMLSCRERPTPLRDYEVKWRPGRMPGPGLGVSTRGR